MIVLIRTLIVLLLFLVTIQSKELTNKEIITQKYSSDKCLNLNENYICINTSIKSNRLHKIISQSQNLKPTYQVGFSASEKELYEVFSKRKSISNKFNLNHYKKYNPIENKSLSKKFNDLFLNTLEDKIKSLNQEPNYLQIEKDIEPLIKLLKPDMFLIRFNNYRSLSVTFDRKAYEFIKYYMYQDIQNFNPTKDIPRFFYYSRSVAKISTEIVSLFQKKLNSDFSDKEIKYLNNKFSSLLSNLLRIRKDKDINEGLNIIYQLLVDAISLSNKDKKLLYDNLIVKNTNINFKKERKIIENFYKNNPLKVFVINTEYKSPFTDGIYGYLYIHKTDVQKLLQNHQLDYLMLHEVNHIVYNLSSLKNQFSQILKNMKMLNSIDNTIIIVEKLISAYDKKNVFQKDFLSVKNIWKDERVNIKQKLELNSKKMINEMLNTNKKELNGMEELAIDLSNLKSLTFPEKNYYYAMLETILPFSHPRLKPIKMSLQLDKFRKKQLNKKEYDLVKACDSITIIWENSKDFKVDTYKKFEIFTKNFYYILKKLKRDDRTYNFINKFYDTNKLSIKLSHLIRYFRFKDAIIKYSVNYTRYSITGGKL